MSLLTSLLSFQQWLLVILLSCLAFHLVMSFAKSDKAQEGKASGFMILVTVFIALVFFFDWLSMAVGIG